MSKTYSNAELIEHDTATCDCEMCAWARSNHRKEPMTPFNETLKCAAYGATSSRKTLQIGNLIEAYGAENVGIISCERGLNTIRSLTDEKYVYVAEDREGLRGAWAWAKENFPSPDQWVCVDGGSRTLQWIHNDIFGGTQKAYEMILGDTPKRKLPESLRPYAAFVTSNDEMNSQGMWIRVGSEAERLLNSFVRLPSNMYWTFWEEQTSIDQYKKGMPWKPDTPGNGALAAVKGTFDFIFRLVDMKDETSTAYFRDTPNRVENYGKTRDDWRGGVKVPDKIAEFNLADFVKLISHNQQPTEAKGAEA